MTDHPASPINEALAPVSTSARALDGMSHVSLWFSLGVGLLVIQMGAYLVPIMGPKDAMMAIVLGSIIGSGLLAWTAKLGTDTGLSSAGLIHHVYGSGFARLPIVLNIVQLVGWTTFELVVMRDGTTAIAARMFDLHPESPLALVVTTLLWGSVLSLLMLGSMLSLVRNVVNRFGLPLVIASLVWLSWQFIGKLMAQDAQAFWNRPSTGEMGLLTALDLVIAMPVSWLPLVADYSRFGRSGGSTMRGTWIGYAIANIWCYGLGIVVASLSEPDANLVNTLLLAQGGLLALGLILLDELDNAYGDVYSGSVSSHALFPTVSIRQWGLAIAILCTGLAMLLPMHALEPFLLLLSSIFVPLYGVILGRMAFGPGQQAREKSFDVAAAVIWLSGIACFHGAAQWAPQFGSALPSLILTFGAAHVTRPR
jgi:putative hydroxymethylpyrimidine transporter CytX